MSLTPSDKLLYLSTLLNTNTMYLWEEVMIANWLDKTVSSTVMGTLSPRDSSVLEVLWNRYK
jgi:hypothetical protein